MPSKNHVTQTAPATPTQIKAALSHSLAFPCFYFCTSCALFCRGAEAPGVCPTPVHLFLSISIPGLQAALPQVVLRAKWYHMVASIPGRWCFCCTTRHFQPPPALKSQLLNNTILLSVARTLRPPRFKHLKPVFFPLFGVQTQCSHTSAPRTGATSRIERNEGAFLLQGHCSSKDLGIILY